MAKKIFVMYSNLIFKSTGRKLWLSLIFTYRPLLRSFMRFIHEILNQNCTITAETGLTSTQTTKKHNKYVLYAMQTLLYRSAMRFF